MGDAFAQLSPKPVERIPTPTASPIRMPKARSVGGRIGIIVVVPVGADGRVGILNAGRFASKRGKRKLPRGIAQSHASGVGICQLSNDGQKGIGSIGFLG